MSKNLNLSEAAAEILASNLASKKGEEFGAGKTLNKAGVAAAEVEIGDAGHKTTDAAYDATKGVPTATPPGAKPPVGSEEMKHEPKQPQEDEGRKDLAVSPEADADASDTIRDRKPGKKPTQHFQANPGATSCCNEDSDGEFKADIAAMLAGENLSEAFVEKATTIFEAAVESRVATIAEEMEDALVEEFELAVETMKEDFATKVDSYLDYVVESWMEDNKLSIDSGLRSEVVEGFIGALKNVFEEHYIDIPEEKVNVVEELADKVTALEDQVNEEISRNIKLRKELSEHKKAEVIHTVCEGLTLNQLEKIKSIAKGVDFTTESEFSDKLEMIKESYYPSNIIPATTNALDDMVILEETESKETKSHDPLMDVYVKTITKSVTKQ